MPEVRAKKALGQHFLVDLNIARKICDALSGGTAQAPCDTLEVGCGMCVLTTRKALPISTNIFRNSPRGYSRAIFCK